MPREDRWGVTGVCERDVVPREDRWGVNGVGEGIKLGERDVVTREDGIEGIKPVSWNAVQAECAES